MSNRNKRLRALDLGIHLIILVGDFLPLLEHKLIGFLALSEMHLEISLPYSSFIFVQQALGQGTVYASIGKWNFPRRHSHDREKETRILRYG